MPSAFFTGGGWQPDKPYYTGSFDPAKQWKSKAKGELMVTFDGDERSTKVTLRALLDHSFSVVALTQNFMNSPECDEEEPDAAALPFARDANGDSSDEEVLVGDLRGRSAAAAARAKMSELSPSGSDSSASAWSPARRKRSSPSTDSSSDSSPLAEQPTPPGSKPRRSPRRPPAAPAPDEPDEPDEPHELMEDSSDEGTERLESERTKFGAKVVCTTKDKFQPVKSLEWTLADPSKLYRS